ncbi:MAG TPA: wax ester/triacylglycerol synthase family O-acyltransferase [Thermoleophilaceae bacterium]|nr:wax ester/triacylglycerol synthase family O-acyltransferase [Thermoleophilaceae bacterium]
MPERLSAIDGSFLRVETRNAHMHVAWSATFRLPAAGPRPTLERLRRSIAGRLEHLPLFRRRLAYPPLGMGEPFWVDDPDFEVGRHVLMLGMPNTEIDDRRFAFLCDGVLSAPLPRDRPLWEVRLAPRLEGGRCGLVAKFHHALVDGKAAVEAALLLFDTEPDVRPAIPAPWRPEARRGTARLAVDALASGAEDSLRATRGAARLAAAPVGGVSRIAGTLRRAALAAGEDLLRPAPSSLLNRRIGPRRTLVRHSALLDDVQTARGAEGATLNDVCLATVAGALRELAIARDEQPRPLKAMVPVSLRGSDDAGALGNRITLAFVRLPLDEADAQTRLARVRAATAAFKEAGRPAGTEAVLGTLGLLPDPLRGVAARAVASPRVYNLTVSNVPGPPVPLFMLGAELVEAHPVVPIAEGHALSVGIFTHLERLHYGLYADPEAFPQVSELPQALDASLRELLLRAREVQRTRGRSRDRPLVASG